MRDYLREAEETAFTSRHDRSVATAVQQAAQTADDLGKGLQRSVRIGDFPESLPYLTRRLEATQRLAILTIPFLQFGVLANPRGQKEFRDTLHELFGRAADALAPGDDERELVIITQPAAVRQAVARHRYDNAVDALRLMHNYPTSFEFRKRTLDDDEYLANDEINPIR